ncbi:hypothetical protein POTOM_038842 [Populus tomentosa]|uniref:Tryptophan/tyrosine permease n=1 Tax=Populus tomentosa TaxID=118781 RepID=A0A8X7YWA5_POPTO|nr:hypothetical protein POTOM_038842 [Populus tomentosa]
MDAQCMPSSSSLHSKSHKNVTVIPPLIRRQQKNTTVFFKYRIRGYLACACRWQQERREITTQSPLVMKAKKVPVELSEEPAKVTEKKGTVAVAVALIIGTSIGSGMLALPQKASPAGVIPSSICMIACWGFLLIEALLLVEINVGLRRKQGKNEDEGELEVISIRTMAQETLGDWGGTLATITYVFLGYTSMIAYSSKSGEILFHLVNLPESVSSCLFTTIFTVLVSVGGTQATDQVNQWLTASMIGLLLAIEVIAVAFGGWSGLEGSGDWGKVPATIPVMIFALVYHDLAPVLCAYLGGDLKRLRTSILLGSIVPLLALLVWDAIALGLSAQADQVVDPVLLMSERWSGVSYMLEAFSLLAVATSLIGTLLGFLEFLKEQLKNLSRVSKATRTLQGEWWERNKINFTAKALAVAPTLVVSTIVPDAFSAATDIAGGYCMTILYGVLPPAMAWAMYNREREDSSQNELSRVRPALLGVGILASGIVVEQILQDFSALHH